MVYHKGLFLVGNATRGHAKIVFRMMRRKREMVELHHLSRTARFARYADERNVGCVYHQRVLFN